MPDEIIDLDERELETYPPPDKRRRPPALVTPTQPPPRKWSGTLPDKFIASLATLVSQTKISAWVNALSGFHTRHTKSADIDQVAQYLHDEFTALGYGDVTYHQYVKQGLTLKNVVCTKAGVGTAGQVMVLCGHYDCIMEQHSNATARAPGADDNASGIAAMLEIARILKDVVLEDTVQFVAFSGEEQGLWGSTAYAQHIQDSGINLHRLVNLDMIGYSPPDNRIYVEYDMGNVQAANDAASQQFGQSMVQMAADYTSLSTSLGNIFASDYMPFEARGYVVVGAYEAGENPNYHSSSDTPDKVDYAYLTDVTRMVLCTVLRETIAVADESSSQVDLYIRDSAADDGSQPSAYPHWKSPDIWVRNHAPDTPGEDPEAGHQPPVNDVPNYLYARVRNRGTAASGPFTVKAYRCDPATGMIWPDHFQEIGSISMPESVPAGGHLGVGPFIWTPHIVDHECLLAVVSSSDDHSIVDVFHCSFDHSLLVRYDNNVGQRNVSPQNGVPGGKAQASIMVRGDTISSINSLLFDGSDFPSDTGIEIRVPRRLLDEAQLTGLSVVRANSKWCYLRLDSVLKGSLVGFSLDAGEEAIAAVTLDISHQAEHLAIYAFEVSQERHGAPVGRYTIEIRAIKESEDYVYGNVRSKELHTVHCPFFWKMIPKNQVPFDTVQDGLIRGYNGCAFCLKEYDNG